MTTVLNREAYEDIIKGDIGWLLMQPKTLERDHILEVLKASADHEYSPTSLVRHQTVIRAHAYALKCRRIILDLMKSFEAYAAMTKPKNEWDEYDEGFNPYWIAAAQFLAERFD